MKQILKKIWIVICLALLINIPIILAGTIRTDMSATLTGDLTNVNSLVEIDTEYSEEGSFSSIYVISFDRTTHLQNLFLKNSIISDLEPIYEGYTHLSDLEISKIGRVQKDSAIAVSLITAYNEAAKLDNNIKISYSLASAKVSYYTKGSLFRIEDEIIKVNDIGVENQTEFINAFNNRKVNDTLTLIRNKEEITFTLDEDNLKSFSCYPIYDIDYDNTFPSVKINNTNVGGPSGGLLQALSIYNRLIEDDLTKGLKIAGTGTISFNGSVGAIGGIKQKIHTAFNRDVDVFFCPEENYDEALKAYNTINGKEKMALVMTKTLDDAITYLKNV